MFVFKKTKKRNLIFNLAVYLSDTLLLRSIIGISVLYSKIATKNSIASQAIEVKFKIFYLICVVVISYIIYKSPHRNKLSPWNLPKHVYFALIGFMMIVFPSKPSLICCLFILRKGVYFFKQLFFKNPSEDKIRSYFKQPMALGYIFLSWIALMYSLLGSMIHEASFIWGIFICIYLLEIMIKLLLTLVQSIVYCIRKDKISKVEDSSG